MTDIFGRVEKVGLKHQLFGIGVQALEQAGWQVERVQGSGKSSVRRITRGPTSHLISIRTTQDTWIAFPRTENDKSWRTLDEVDAVVAVSVDDPRNPKFARVHMIEGNEMRNRFNRAYAARKRAGHTIPIGRGVWVSLYLPESPNPVSHVGAGAGVKFPPIATVPLNSDSDVVLKTEADNGPSPGGDAPLTIADAKRQLAITLGVDPANIKITVEA